MSKPNSTKIAITEPIACAKTTLPQPARTKDARKIRKRKERKGVGANLDPIKGHHIMEQTKAEEFSRIPNHGGAIHS